MVKLNAFVTGATGLIGGHLLIKLLQNNYAVKALYRSQLNINLVRKLFVQFNLLKEFDEITWVQGDILDIELLSINLKNIDHVFHLAALVSFDPNEADEMFKINIEGTANMINASLANDISKFCFVSSISALGDSTPGSIISEESEFKFTKNTSAYGLSKYQAELEVWRGQEEGLNVLIVNPSLVLGEGFWDNSSGKLISKINKGLRFYTTGIVSIIDVVDLCNIIIILSSRQTSGERYIISNKQIPNKTLLSTIANKLGKTNPSINIKLIIASCAWRLESIRCSFTNQKPLITKETVRASFSTTTYDNRKFLESTNYVFTDFEKTISRICNSFKESN